MIELLKNEQTQFREQQPIAIEAIFPDTIEEIVRRAKDHLKRIDTGVLLEKGQNIGLPKDWLEAQFARPLYFGMAIQPVPLLSDFAFGELGKVFPETLREEMTRERAIEAALNIEETRAELKILLLKNDMMAANGPTAVYRFFFGTTARGETKTAPIIPEGNAKTLAGRAFIDATLNRDEFNKMIDRIRENTTTEKGRESAIVQKMTRDRKLNKDDIKQATNLFIEDLTFIFEDLIQNGDTPDTIKYFDFIAKFNELVLERFAENNPVPVFASDDGVLDTLVMNRGTNWKVFLNFLAENELFDFEKDFVFKFKVPAGNGVKKFVKLKVATEAIENGRLKDDNFILVNMDFRDNGRTGEPRYLLNQLIDTATFDLEGGEQTILSSKTINYFLELTGFANIMVGMDGVKNDAFFRVSAKAPEIIGGDPIAFAFLGSIGMNGYSKNDGYGFNETCTILDFYIFMLEMMREREIEQLMAV